jgi:hypothetical protein
MESNIGLGVLVATVPRSIAAFQDAAAELCSRLERDGKHELSRTVQERREELIEAAATVCEKTMGEPSTVTRGLVGLPRGAPSWRLCQDLRDGGRAADSALECDTALIREACSADRCSPCCGLAPRPLAPGASSVVFVASDPGFSPVCVRCPWVN